MNVKCYPNTAVYTTIFCCTIYAFLSLASKLIFKKNLSMMNIIEHLSDFLGRRQSILVETTEHHGGAF